MTESTFQSAVGGLQKLLSRLSEEKLIEKYEAESQEDYNRFRPVFSLNGIHSLNIEEFKAFLSKINNRHWSGLARQGPRLLKDPIHWDEHCDY